MPCSASNTARACQSGVAVGRGREAAAQADIPAKGAEGHQADRSFAGPASRERYCTTGSHKAAQCTSYTYLRSPQDPTPRILPVASDSRGVEQTQKARQLDAIKNPKITTTCSHRNGQDKNIMKD